MNDEPRQQLIQLIATHGIDLCDDPRKCEGLLRDHCGEYNLEIILIVNALNEHITEDLLKTQEGEPVEVLIGRLSERLQTNRGLSKEAAIWAVETWAIALGIIDKSITKKNEDLGDKEKATKSEQVRKEDRKEKKESSVKEIIVSLSGDGDYFSINEALLDASDGDRIIVMPGWYKENIELTKSIKLSGKGARKDIVLESDGGICISSKAKSAEISNFTLRSSPVNTNTLVKVIKGKTIINNCHLFPTGKGIGLDGSPEVYISNTIIEGGSEHIYIDGGTVRATESRFSSSKEEGIYISDKADVMLINCKIQNCEEEGISIMDDAYIILENCEIINGRDSGIYIGSSWQIRLIMRDCKINHNSFHAIGGSLHENSKLEVTNCDLRYNGSGPSRDELKAKLSAGENLVDYRSNETDEKDSSYNFMDIGYISFDDKKWCSNCMEMVKPSTIYGMLEWCPNWCPNCYKKI